jgi:hypothetical protein
VLQDEFMDKIPELLVMLLLVLLMLFPCELTTFSNNHLFFSSN